MPHSPSQRREAILKNLIEAYLPEGEPVGSRLLASRYDEPISAATIRNVLSDLADQDLLAQPHTSAGRVPTQKAYRWYVDHWILPTSPDQAVGARLAPALDIGGKDLEAWLRSAGRVLSEVMNGICVAVPLHLHRSRLVRLEFVPLGPGRLVAVWVGTSGEVEHQVIDNAWNLDAATLVELGNFATHRFLGCTLPEMRQRLLAALQDQADQVRSLWGRLTALAAQLQDPAEAEDPPVVVQGLGQLGRRPEFGAGDRFRELVEAFDEHERLVRLVNAFALASTADVQLLLGTENPYLGTMPLATAIRTVTLGPGQEVAFALFSPMRVDYARLLGGLAWWSEALDRQVGRPV